MVKHSKISGNKQENNMGNHRKGISCLPRTMKIIPS